MDKKKPLLVIACGALAKELVQLRQLNGWNQMDIQCLPPALHNHPLSIPVQVDSKLSEARHHYRRIFVAYADCGTGGRLDEVLARHGVKRLPGAHCYEALAGADAFAELADTEPGTFYLTDFLVRNFQRLVIEGLGLDRHPELLQVYFAHYRRLVHLDQSGILDLRRQARQCAEQLGLQFECRFTGLQTLDRHLDRAIMQTIAWQN